MNPLSLFGNSEILGERTKNEFKSKTISEESKFVDVSNKQTPPDIVISSPKPKSGIQQNIQTQQSTNNQSKQKESKQEPKVQFPELGMPPSYSQPQSQPQRQGGLTQGVSAIGKETPKEIKVLAFQHKALNELQKTYSNERNNTAKINLNSSLSVPSNPDISFGDIDSSPNPKIKKYQNDSTKLRVLFCGTYPIGQSNGYSRVVYYIAKYLGRHEDDLQFTVYGFQNYKQTAGSEIRNNIPKNVILHDALETEEPRRHGFGEKEIGTFLRKNPQDVVIIFNDMVVTGSLVQTIMNELTPAERSKFLLVSYMDQVYPYQKKMYMDMLNNYFDAIIAFTPYWRKIVRILGLKKEIPCFVFPHGFDHELYYPIPRKTARVFFNIPEDAFVILNLNRNQPRKRWDHTMIAFAELTGEYYKYVKANPGKKTRPICLMVGTSLDGPWDIKEVYQHELHLRGVPHSFAENFIVALANPQQLSDRDINILYNACDIGINTCEGEGYGLCQIEHLGVGAPQVCPRIGGLQEFVNENNSTPIEAKWKYYIDKGRDGIGGIAEIGDPLEYGQAMWKYYLNPKLYEKHSKQGRKDILTHYRWETVVEYFYHLLKHISTNVKKQK